MKHMFFDQRLFNCSIQFAWQGFSTFPVLSRKLIVEDEFEQENENDMVIIGHEVYFHKYHKWPKMTDGLTSLEMFLEAMA